MSKIGFIMVGVSGSGKSTVVRQLQARHASSSLALFSLDICRINFWKADHSRHDLPETVLYSQAYKYATESELLFKLYVEQCWQEALKHEIVIVDNTNLTRKSRARWIADLRAKKFTIAAVQVMAPLYVVLKRQNERSDKRVPADIILDMYFRQQEILLGSEADILFNVDGTSTQELSLA